jgi:hypothetical protein
MQPEFKLNWPEFNATLRAYIADSSRELSQILNSRLFYLLARAFLLLRPASPQTERNRIRDYLREPLGDVNKVSRKTGKKLGKTRLLRRVHLITQAKNRKAGNPGLYGDDMKKASAGVLRRSINSVGYLAAPVAKAIKKLQGHFSQFGGTAGSIGGVRPYAANKALVALAEEYGITDRSNVGLHKGAYSFIKQAKPEINPRASADMALAISDGNQMPKVDSKYNAAFGKAFADELGEMKRHIAKRMQEHANKFNARKV